MSDVLLDAIQAQGFAPVLVVLKSSKSTKAVELAAGTDETQAAAEKLEKHFKLPRQAQALALSADLKRRAPRSAVRTFPNLGLMLGLVDRAGVSGLRAAKEVAVVRGAPVLSLIRPIRKAALAGQAMDGPTWGIQRLGVLDLWKQGLTGRGVIVGHLDTGVDGTHPALQGAIHRFGKFDLQGDLVPDAPATDSDEHGTHTAGTIAGRTVNNMQFGVAPGAGLASAMVIEGGDVTARILGGMDWIIGQGARILSMSLGLRGYVADFLELTQILRNRGVLPVFAVGNEGPGTSRSPGNYAQALSVGACAQDDTVASFSSSQQFTRPDNPIVPSLVAPGVNVLSCIPGGRYAQMDGTSMATPHMAGFAALLLQAKPEATVDELEAAIFKSCTRPTSMSKERANRGVPSGPSALSALVGTKRVKSEKTGVGRGKKAAR